MGKKPITGKKFPPGKRKPASAGGAAKPGKKKRLDRDTGDPHRVSQIKPDVTVVGIGASAGGLEALQQLFKPLPADCALSFVVIQHLSPNYKSAMDQLLSRTTTLPIVQIKNNLNIEPGRIYLSPPEKFVSMARDKFRLTPSKALGRRSFLPIDHFLNKLALEKREKAVCIILSGSASDGTQGLKAVKAAGGRTFVQSPDNSKYASMPESAIATQMVDFILPAAEIAEKLIAVLNHPHTCHIEAAPTQEKSLGFKLRWRRISICLTRLRNR